MKSFTQSNRIAEFKIKCVKSGIAQHALVKAIMADDGKFVPGIAECHGSCGDETCAKCQYCVTSIFFNDQEPDDLYLNPIVPQQSPFWRA